MNETYLNILTQKTESAFRRSISHALSKESVSEKLYGLIAHQAVENLFDRLKTTSQDSIAKDNHLDQELNLSKDGYYEILVEAKRQALIEFISPSYIDENKLGVDFMCTHIWSFASEAVDTTQNDFTPVSDEGKFELFMFYFFLGWTYFLERDMIDRSAESAQITLLYIYDYSSRVLRMPLKVDEMIKLYRVRVDTYKKDIRGVQQVDYPNTKMYLPSSTFAGIFVEPLADSPYLGWTDFEDMSLFDSDLYEQLSMFTRIMVKQINNSIQRFSKL